ncbi:sugar phosphate isomerase/epimerase, partial [Sinorhizobium meliloti]
AIRGSGLKIEGVCFPHSVEDLRLPLELAAEFPVSHINLQPGIRFRLVEDCLPLLDGWMRLAEDAGIPVFIETHRDRMTTDLFFTLDLLDHRPDLPLLADLSHFLVGREFAVPVDAENHAMIRRILRNAQAFHGRVASREQVQIEISFPHHRPWVDLFLEWWSHGFRNWRSRAADDAELVFIIGMIEASKDITLNEMVLRLEEDRSVSIGRSTLDVWLRKRGFIFKKRPHMHWSRSGQTS